MEETKIIQVEKGELAWHDLQRSLKIRKPIEGGISSSVFALAKGKDAWHHDAFVGTGVEDMIAGKGTPRASVFHGIDWCGNVIGQIEDCPYGPIGTDYRFKGLGVEVTYKLADYGAELDSNEKWVWWLLFSPEKPLETDTHDTAN